MLNPVLSVFNESGLRLPVTRAELSAALEAVEKIHRRSFDFVELVLVSEEGISAINAQHLGKTYVTDIITFPYHETADAPPEGTLYLCVPRIKEQAVEFEASFKMEFSRVFIHGLLHLLGLDDKTPELKEAMHREENRVLKELGYGN